MAILMTVLKCDACQGHATPPRHLCPHCHQENLREVEVEGRGTLAAKTTIRRAPTRFVADAPYVVAVVDLDCGARVTGRAIDSDQIAIDEPVILHHVTAGIPYFGPRGDRTVTEP